MVNYLVVVMIICNLLLWGIIVFYEIIYIVYNDIKL